MKKSFFAAFLVGLLAFGLAAKAPKQIPPMLVAPWDAVATVVYLQSGADPEWPDGPTDVAYACPTGKEIDRMLKWVYMRQDLNYLPEAHDCDDISMEWRVLAHKWGRKMLTKKKHVSFSAHIAYVKINPGAFGFFTGEGLHAVGVIVDNEGIMWLIEPMGPFKVRAIDAKLDGTIEVLKIVW